MADKEIDALERLVLKQSVGGFTPGSELGYYFSLLKQLQSGASLLASDLLAKFAAAYPASALLKSVQLRALLADYDKSDQATKASLLERLNRDYLYLTFDVPESTSAAQATSRYPSELNPAVLQVDLQKAQKDLDYFLTLTLEEYKDLNVEELSREVFERMVTTPAVRLYPEVLKRLARAIEVEKIQMEDWLDQLSLDQLHQLVSLCPSLMDQNQVVATLFSGQFPVSPSDSAPAQVIVLLRALDWTASLSPKFSAYRKQVLFDILSLTPAYGEYREDLFLEYIRLHSPGDIFIVTGNVEECYVASCLFDRYSDSDLIHSYLERILSSKDSPALFAPYLNSDYLQREFAYAKLVSGSDPASLFISPSVLESLSDQVVLELASDNPKVFNRADDVTLKVYTKNVPKLIVRVLELNVLAYSLEHSEPVPEDVNLDGLEACYQEVLDYSQESKWLKKTRTIAVPMLKGKAGLFAVELFGNGLRTRVLVKKGALKLVSRVTAAGHQLTVLNEANQVCVAPGSGLYLHSRFYALSDSQRSVIVPFRDYQVHSTAVVTDGEVVDCVTFLHRAERYELKCGFILMEESLQMGAMASFALQPKLFVSGLPGPSELMKDMLGIVTIVDMENISSEKKYTGLVLSAEGLIQLEFEVPAKAVSVTLQFTCQVTPMSTSKPLTLTANRLFQVNQNSSSSSCKQLFLRRAQGLYYVQVLGKNGEAKAREIVTVWIELKGGRVVPDIRLSSNETGLINLGALDTAKTVRVTLFEDSSITNQWNIESFRPVVQYPANLTLCEGDSFGLPLRRKGDLTAPLSLLEAEMQTLLDSQIVTAGTVGLRYDPESELLLLEHMKEGKYALILASKTRIDVEVLKGSHWGNNQYIVTDQKVVQTYKQYRSLMISSAELRESSLLIQLAGDYEDAKVHVLLHTFLAGSCAATYQGLAVLAESKPNDEVNNPTNRSSYCSSTVLSEEYQYVLERKLQEKVTGNNLPKPQLLLRPESTKGKDSFSPSEPMCDEDYYGGGGGGGAMQRARCSAPTMRRYTEVSNSTDFLLNPAVMKLACPVTADGSVTLQVPQGDYSLVTVMAANDDSSAYYMADLDNLALKTKDLSLQMPLNSKKTYAETRKCSVVKTTEELNIVDVAGASLQLVDSVDKLAQLLIQVSRLAGSGLQIQEWDFLGSWHMLSKEEKGKKYDQYCSHELNLFLYMKDKGYFEEVIRPFLASKMERTLVDKFLLSEPLDHYIPSISSLNTLEKVLLLSRVEDVSSLAETLRNQAKVLSKDEATEQRLFDAVLKFHIQGGEDEQEAQIAEATRAAEAQRLQEYRSQPKGDQFLESALETHSTIMMMDAKTAATAPIGGLGIVQRGAPLSRSSYVGSEMLYRASAPQSKGPGMVARAKDMLMMKSSKSSAKSKSLMVKEADESVGYEEMSEIGSETLLEQREAQRPYFQQMDSTKEYSETQYYGLKNPAEFTTRVPLSHFWAQLAESATTGNLSILSPSVLHCTSNLTVFIAALAFSDLPLQPCKHGFLSQNLGIRIKAASNFLAFHRSMDEAVASLQDSVLCTQRFFIPADRYFTNAAGEQEERPVQEFVAGTVYGSQVIVTNVSVASLSAHVLVQVPEGAIPVANLDYTKSHLMGLAAYETKTVEYFFYFPSPGDYPQAPVNVSVSGEVISVSPGFRFIVKETKSILLEDSLKDIAALGDMDLAVSFLRKNSPHKPEVYAQLSTLLWMLRDQTKYAKLVGLLRELQCFHKEIWAYSVPHCDEQSLKELLGQEKAVLELVGAHFSSTLLNTGTQHSFHFDYSPMVNARAYRLANQSRIVNSQFRATYKDCLFSLAHKTTLNPSDYFVLVQYFLYQDRVIEAKELVSRLKMKASETSPGLSPLQLQFDYLVCYLYPEIAANLSLLYRNYPVTKWRELFALVRQQFEEEKEELVAAETAGSSLSFTIERGLVQLTYANVTTCWVRLYEIDIEVLFSRNPFFMKETELFTYVCPNAVYSVTLDSHSTQHTVELGEKWTRLNIFVEVEYEGKKVFQTYFASDLTCQVIQAYGLVQVTDSAGKGVPRTYVKAFAKDQSGQTSFYKDGYTDVRGKFDYVSLNTTQLDKVESFALLVVHDSLGATVLTAKPPAK